MPTGIDIDLDGVWGQCHRAGGGRRCRRLHVSPFDRPRSTEADATVGVAGLEESGRSVRVFAEALPPGVDISAARAHASVMTATSRRVEQIVSLVAELTPEERVELAERLEVLEVVDDPGKRTRVADAIRRVVRDHPAVLSVLAK
ncbi:MAG: hypothetical protein JOZ69_03330 [Myxococcales bacterium]|nr:hypothetical protein [Myxococcales bacterium]